MVKRGEPLPEFCSKYLINLIISSCRSLFEKEKNLRQNKFHRVQCTDRHIKEFETNKFHRVQCTNRHILSAWYSAAECIAVMEEQ